MRLATEPGRRIPVRYCRPVVTVVGIGAEGWAGLSTVAQDAIISAEVLMGSGRQLDLVPPCPAHRISWPSPLLAALPGLLAEYADRRVCVLASGDPMFFGVGVTIIRLLGPDQVHVLPHASSVSLACARLGWPLEQVEIVSLVGRPLDLLAPAVVPGNRVLVLSSDGSTPADVAKYLAGRGYGASELTVLEQLGSDRERLIHGTAESWHHEETAALNVVGVCCRPDPGAVLLPRVPGLPDEAYDHDGRASLPTCSLSSFAQDDDDSPSAIQRRAGQLPRPPAVGGGLPPCPVWLWATSPPCSTWPSPRTVAGGPELPDSYRLRGPVHGPDSSTLKIDAIQMHICHQ
jgi:precorrin-6y C5,15-methyltransferase (decarboxylating) CbiE subunit